MLSGQSFHNLTLVPMKRLIPVLLVASFFLTGCYASKVTGTAEPSNRVVEKKWATGVINGLAMPGGNVNVSDECPNGIAAVETKLSFLNLLANGITFGLYSPMSIKVTCARGGSASNMQGESSSSPQTAEEVTEAVNEAIQKTQMTGDTQTIRF